MVSVYLSVMLHKHLISETELKEIEWQLAYHYWSKCNYYMIIWLSYGVTSLMWMYLLMYHNVSFISETTIFEYPSFSRVIKSFDSMCLSTEELGHGNCIVRWWLMSESCKQRTWQYLQFRLSAAHGTDVTCGLPSGSIHSLMFFIAVGLTSSSCSGTIPYHYHRFILTFPSIWSLNSSQVNHTIIDLKSWFICTTVPYHVLYPYHRTVLTTVPRITIPISHLSWTKTSLAWETSDIRTTSQ